MRTTRRLVPAIVTVVVLLAGCTSAGASGAPSPLPTTVASPTDVSSPARSPSTEPDWSAGECVSRSDDFSADARGPKGDPVELVRAALVGLRASDSLTREDDDTGAAVAILRDGGQVGRVHFIQDVDGGWLLDGAVLCAGLALTDPSAAASPAATPPGTPVPASSSPSRFDLAACQTEGLCGTATLEPTAVHVGDTVTVATNAYFPIVSTAWCSEFGVAFDYAPPDSPGGAFTTAPVRIVDSSHGVLRVPGLPVGEHTVTFVCGRDAAFAHPEFDGRLEVLAGSG